MGDLIARVVVERGDRTVWEIGGRGLRRIMLRVVKGMEGTEEDEEI